MESQSKSTLFTQLVALAASIEYLRDTQDVIESPAFKRMEHRPQANQNAIGKLLFNAWSAEYALGIKPVVDDSQYLQSSLHWTFPQVYYSVLFSARAFLAAHDINLSNEEVIRRRVASMVVSGVYPKSISWYAVGAFDSYRIYRLTESQEELITLLKQTRNSRMNQLCKAIQLNPKTALRNPNGEIAQKFTTEQYKQLAQQIGSTSFFDALSRLRISSNNPELEIFKGGEVDVQSLHQALVKIVSLVNEVHELYVAKAIGFEAYTTLVRSLPSYLQESFVSDRLNHISFLQDELVY